MDMDAFMQSLSFAADDPEAPTQVFIQSTIDSDPVGGKMLPASSSVEGGFGPGPYTGGYTGVEEGGGLTGIYWGSFDDVPSTVANNPSMGPAHVGPGGLIQNIVGPDGSSTGGTILLPRSETTSVTAVDPMITPGETIATPGGTEMIQLGARADTVVGTDYGTDAFSRTGGKPGIAAGGHSEAI